MFKEAAQRYESLYPYLNDQVQFLFEYAQSLSNAGQYAQSNEVLKKSMQICCVPMLYNLAGKNYQELKAYELAEAYLRQSALIVPNRIYPHYLLMKLYIEMGDKEKAKATARIVLTKEPKVQSES